MWLSWLSAIGTIWAAIWLATGVFALLLLVMPHPQDVYLLINLSFLLVGIVLGGSTVILLLREQLRLFNQTLRELIQVSNEALEQLHPFYMPAVSLPPDVSFVIMAKPIRPEHPVYRVVKSGGRDRFFRWDESGVTFHSNPDEASLWTEEIFGIQAALACAKHYGREQQFFVEELEAEAIGVAISEPGGQDEANN